jgi:hypothetical protein
VDAYWRSAINAKQLLKASDIPDDMIPELVSYFRMHIDGIQRENLVWLLGEIGPRAAKATPALERIRDNEEGSIVSAAIVALKKISKK